MIDVGKHSQNYMDLQSHLSELVAVYARASLPGSVYWERRNFTISNQGKLIYRGKPYFYMAYTVNAVRQAPSTHTPSLSRARTRKLIKLIALFTL